MPHPLEPPRRPLPAGTVTFLLTDVESSTTGWEADRAAMAAAVVRHYEILDAAIDANGGVRPVEQGEGDSIVAAFTLASAAVRAAVAIQRALLAEPWPDGGRLAVRIALHTGEAQLRGEGNYMGRAVIRTARMRAIGHGGQILCSHATADLSRDDLPDGASLSDLGAHRLKDLGRPERVFQVCHPDIRREFPPLRSLDAVPNNLPVALTSFIGREDELRDVARLAAQHRLVTLTGAGGTGKTRLAARVAGELAATHRDGAWWVELAALAEPSLVAEAVLGVLQVADSPERSALQRLTAHLATRGLLLVLDNCEHVLDACAALGEVVLRGCPDVALLATSREALGVPGEVTWHVPPMGLPAAGGVVAVESLRSYDAVQLFIDRAVKARPNFAVTNATAPLVAEICARLDGIPLAIELAAARIRVLSLRQILDGLEDRFRLLTGGVRSALPRQQTLEASVAWSHGLLTEDERMLFRRLSVFAGGFTLDAAEDVCPGTGPGLDAASVLDLLDGLVAKSLVLVVEDEVSRHDEDAASRYRLLETIREFAALELARAEETAAARDAHQRFYGRFCSVVEEQLVGVNASVLRRLGADQDNLRAALDWALVAGDPGPALELASSHALLLMHRGRSREAREALARALAVPDAPPAERCCALWVVALLMWTKGDVDGLTSTTAETLALALESGDRRLEGRAYEATAWLHVITDPDVAKQHLAKALPLAEDAGDAWVLMDIPCEYSHIAARCDDVAASAVWLPRERAAAMEHGNDLFLAWNGINEAAIATRLGDLPRARAAAERGLDLAMAAGETAVRGVAAGLLAEIDVVTGHPERALAVAEPALRDCEAGSGDIALPRLYLAGALAAAALRDPSADAALEQAVAVAVRLGDPWPYGIAALALAARLAARGALADAEAQLAAAREVGRMLGSPWVPAEADRVAALVEAARDEPNRAESLLHVALAAHAEHGFALGVVDCLEALAVIAAAQESWAEAVRLLAATAQRRDELGYRYGRGDTAPAEEAGRAALGPEAYEAAWADGAELPIEAAVAYASRARGERKRPSSGWASLTPTELEVARLAAQGMSNAEIGRKLFITGGTAKVHLSHIYAKLDLANRAELAAEVTRRGT